MSPSGDKKGKTMLGCHRNHATFSSVDPSIAQILRLEDDTQTGDINDRVSLDLTTLDLVVPNSSATLAVHDLIPLARKIDKVAFSSLSSCPRGKLLQCDKVIRLIRQHEKSKEYSAWIVACTLVALNSLESAICASTGFTRARAPLLTTMLQKLDQGTALTQVLRLFLLPCGLNFRNLIWHGFVGDGLPREWLSLTVYLTYQISSGQGVTEPTMNGKLPETISGLIDKYSVLETVAERGGELRRKLALEGNSSSCSPAVVDFLPKDHHCLWELTVLLFTNEDCPWLVSTLLVIMLEHSLRLDWCKHNDRWSDSIAQQGQFYVTIDGHGQRHKHSLMLHPFVYEDSFFNTAHNSDENGRASRNNLLGVLGPGTTSLLMDLLMSPEGPNIRAALSHGRLDEFLNQEVIAIVDQSPSDRKEYSEMGKHSWDVVDLLLGSLDCVVSSRTASNKFRSYRPIFSYTATTIRRLQFLQKEFASFECGRSQWEKTRFSAVSSPALFDTAPSLQDLDLTFQKLQRALGSGSEWNLEALYHEHDLNKHLASSGAALLLLGELAQMLASYRIELEKCVALTNSDNAGKAIHRRLARFVAMATTFERFFCYVTGICIASLFLRLGPSAKSDKKELLAAVKRSRMAVSTVSTFIALNSDRALNAIVEYSKAKSIKKLEDVFERDPFCKGNPSLS